MSKFTVSVVTIDKIEPILNADAIELAVIGDYRSVVKKDDYKVGQLAVYIPEQSVVPYPLLRSIGLNGKLAGPKHNRVKAIKLRGQLSQGILLPVRDHSFILVPSYVSTTGVEITDDTFDVSKMTMSASLVEEGDDVADLLGIVKYEPTIPASMSGEVYNAGIENTVNYDIENVKRYPSIINSNDDVVFTEKLHGTFCGVGILPLDPLWNGTPPHIQGQFVVFSKGLGAQGLCFKDNKANENNIYLRTLKSLDVFTKLYTVKDQLVELGILGRSDPFFLLGEVFGAGVQDMAYGTQPTFRIFDMCFGSRGSQKYINYKLKKAICDILELPMVPVLYKGPFSKEKMNEYTNGYETVTGNNIHIREGIVITPEYEQRDDTIGRVILKSVSESYLLRRGNVTEYQ